MKVYNKVGVYGEGNSYIIETLKDFDEYEKLLGKETIRVCYPNFYEFKEDFKKYIGKVYTEKESKYRIIAIEDDQTMCDWYWVVQNIDDERDIKYLLCNDPDIYKRIK